MKRHVAGGNGEAGQLAAGMVETIIPNLSILVLMLWTGNCLIWVY
jgi:hypothetical protein